jgi:hypothetical protein
VLRAFSDWLLCIEQHDKQLLSSAASGFWKYWLHYSVVQMVSLHLLLLTLPSDSFLSRQRDCNKILILTLTEWYFLCYLPLGSLSACNAAARCSSRNLSNDEL